MINCCYPTQFSAYVVILLYLQVLKLLLSSFIEQVNMLSIQIWNHLRKSMQFVVCGYNTPGFYRHTNILYFIFDSHGFFNDS